MKFNVVLPNSCAECPYKTSRVHRYGKTYHCVPEVSEMDVTNATEGTRSLFCPIAKLCDYILKKEKVAKAAQELDQIVNECACMKCSDDIRMACKGCDQYREWINRLKGERELAK